MQSLPVTVHEACQEIDCTSVVRKCESAGIWGCDDAVVPTGKIRGKLWESQAFNSILKRLQAWKEVPVNAVVLSLNR